MDWVTFGPVDQGGMCRLEQSENELHTNSTLYLSSSETENVSLRGFKMMTWYDLSHLFVIWIYLIIFEINSQEQAEEATTSMRRYLEIRKVPM